MNDFKVLLQAAIDLQKSQNKLNEDIKELQKNAKIEIDLSTANAKKALNQFSKEYQESLNIKKSNVKQNITTYLLQNTKMAKDSRAEFVRLREAIDSVDDTKSLSNISKEVNTLKLRIKGLGQEGRSVGDEIANNVGKLFTWLSASTVIFSSIRAFKDVTNNVIELDKSMISLRKVTDETNAKYEEFLQTATQTAKELGSSVTDIIDMTAEWAKLGYAIDEASELAKASAIYQNVGELKNSQTAVSNLVTAMKAYNIESSDAITIVDKLNEIENKFAVNSEDLGAGLANSASALALAGNSIDENLAMLTAMTEITQNASESGNAIKVLSMRLRGMKGELEAIGEEYENIESVSKIQTQIYNLTQGKVNIMDDLDPTKFKSTYEIMLGISNVWKDISEVDQAKLLEIIAGKQRGNSIAALLTSMSQASNVLETSLNSAGSALREQDNYTKGIQYSIDRLTASLQEMANTTLDSSTVKFFVDLTNNVVNATTSVGGLIPVLSTLAVIFLSFNKNKKYTFLQEFISKLIAMKTQAGATTIAVGGLTLSVKALTFALSSGVLVALTAVIQGIASYRQAQEEALEVSKQLTQTYKDEQKSLTDQITSYEKLQKQLQQGNISTEDNAIIKTQLLTIQDSLIEKFGLEANAIDLVNGKYDEQIEKLNTLSEQKANEYIALNEKGFTDAQNRLNNVGTYSLTGDYADNFSKELVDYLSSYEGLKIESVSRGIFGSFANIKIPDVTKEQFKDLLIKLYSDVGDEFANSSEAKEFQSTISNILSGIDLDQIEADKETVRLYTKALVLSNNTLRPLYQQAQDAVKSYNEALSSGEGIEKAKANLDEVKSKVSENINAVNGAGIVFDNIFSGISETIEQTIKSSEDEILSLSKAMDSMMTSGKAIEDVKSEIKDLGYISSDTLNKLISKYPELESVVAEYNSGLASTEDVLNELSGVYETDFENYRNAVISKIGESDSFYNSFVEKLPQWVKDLAKSYNLDFDNYKSLNQAKFALDQEYSSKKALLNTANNWKSEMQKSDKDIYNPFSMDGMVYGANEKLREQIQKDADEINKIINGIDTSLSTTLNLNGYTSSSNKKTEKGKSGKEKKEKDPIIESFNKVKATLDHKREMDIVDEEYYYNRLEELYKKYFSNKTKYLEQNRQYEEEVYKGRNQLPDLNLKAFDELKAMLDHKREMGIVDEEYYYKRLEELYTTHFGKEKQSLLKTEEEKQNYIEKYRKYREEVYKGEQQLIKDGFDAVNKEISKYDDTLSEIDHLGGLVDDNSVESLALLQTGYKVATDKANALNEEIVALNKRYADGKIEEELYTDQLDNLTGQLYDASSAMTKYKNAISDYYKVQKENFEDDYENEVKGLEDAHKDTLDALDKQLEKYKDIVDEKKKSLRATEDEYQYQKKLTEHNKTISDIQDELTDIKKAADQGDREAIKRRGELEDELAKAQSDLADTQHDHEVDLAEKALDEELDLYEKMIKGQIGIADSQLQTDLANVKTLYDEKLASVNRLYEQEKFLIENMASLTVEEFTKAYETIGQLASQNGLSLSPSFSQAMNSMNPMVANILGDGSKSKEKLNSKSSDLNRYLSSNGYNLLDEKGMLQLAQALGLVDVKSISDLKGNKGVVNKNRILELLKRAKFTTGGMILTNGLVKSTGEDAVALVKNKEIILNQTDSKTFKDFVPLMKNFVQTFKPNIPNVSNITNNNSNAPNISITIPITGNADANTVVQLRKFETDIVNKVAKEILGVKRKS